MSDNTIHPYDGEDEPETTTEPSFYVVAPYLIDKVYGGPEEGGWYYEAGELVTEAGFPIPVVTKTIEEATEVRHKMQQELNVLNEGRPDISSVLSRGVYYAEIHENELLKYYPAERPYYE